MFRLSNLFSQQLCLRPGQWFAPRSQGVEKGFYARVSRLGSQWLELDLHFLSLGGGEIALGWWFEECLVPYLVNTSKLEAVQSISIVTGYGKTRSRGARMNDDGMRLRVRAMLKHMCIKETPQPNKGRIHINKQELIEEVKKNEGKVIFDHSGYTHFKEAETTSNKFPDVPQQVRARFRPAKHGEGPPGTFIREGMENDPGMNGPDDNQGRHGGDSYMSDRRDHNGRQGSYSEGDRGQGGYGRGSEEWNTERRASYGERGNGDGFGDRRGSYNRDQSRGSGYGGDGKGPGGFSDRRNSYNDRRGSYGDSHDKKSRYSDGGDRRGSNREWESRNSFDRRPIRDHDRYRDDNPRDDIRMDDVRRDSRRFDDRDQKPRSSAQRSSNYGKEDGQGFRKSYEGDNEYGAHGSMRDSENSSSNHFERDRDYLEPSRPNSDRSMSDFHHNAASAEPSASASQFRDKRTSDSALYVSRKATNEGDMKEYPPIKEDPDPYAEEASDAAGAGKKRSFDDYRGQASNRGYNIEPNYAKRRSV